MRIAQNVIILGLVITLVLLAIQGEIVTKILGFIYAAIILLAWFRNAMANNA
jgi:hypothetical protein